MYTIISGTNRQDSNTYIIARHYQEFLLQHRIEAGFISLKGLNVMERNPEIMQLEQDLLIPSKKFVFIMPEYNGSFPGVLKAFIDITDIRKVWWGKKALLTGVSTGRAGNLRGMEHLTGILNYLKVIVHPEKLPISVVDKLLNEEDRLTDKLTLEAIDKQLKDFISL